jgi:hypothetical protein
MFETLIPMLLKAMGYEKAQFDSVLKKAEQFAEDLKARLLKTEESIFRLETKIDLLFTKKEGE